MSGSNKISKTILITGGAGFIGSNFIPYMLKKNAEVNVVNLDKLTYAGNKANLTEVEQLERYHFIQGDICDKDVLQGIFEKYHVTGVIHFAAESHVDNSISGPDSFIKTNIEGTFNLLETVKKHWIEKPWVPKTNYEEARFYHISTDEVYGSLGKEGAFNEKSPYAPNSPYSASKASSDFLVRSYHHTYGLNTVTSNCSNNYGPKQHDEKLIPTIIRKALEGAQIPIYGDGQNIRDWLYVIDHCEGIYKAFTEGVAGETYVIGGNNEHNNLSIAEHICSILDEKFPKETGAYKDQIHFVKDRPGHDFRYAINADKIETELGWSARENFNSGLRKTIDWYIKKYQKV
ncbi:dTDP-glucose 4,6-dehydratase [Spongiimicrobium salis]|uniref:dTDP-glucose 4,6-dehydratase n=1 Tax=Spongiimicrobium salis TaxID=1667022 RepID=UPI00374D27AE